MKRNTIALLGLLLLICGSMMGQSAEEAEMMKKWQAAMTPGEHHAWMEHFVGEWTYTQTMFMDPTQPPMKSEGKTSGKMTMGGRYLQENHNGNTMGMPFQGQAITGFDNLTGVFRSHWIDNLGTGFMIAEGDRKGNILEMTAAVPNFDGGEDQYRMVTEIIDEDHHKMKMYRTIPGEKETMDMEFMYTRVK